MPAGPGLDAWLLPFFGDRLAPWTRPPRPRPPAERDALLPDVDDAREVPPERLCGCDPVEASLDHCRRGRVPATFARSGFLPSALPFPGRFDLAFAFSVFTHLSEEAHERCLSGLHASLSADGILVVTIRPPGLRPRPRGDARARRGAGGRRR